MELIKSSYRPVSNLSYISKLVQKAMLDQINNHCNNCNLLQDYQSAYRENRSCETVLLKLTNDLLRSTERKNVTVLIALNYLPPLIQFTIVCCSPHCRLILGFMELHWNVLKFT